MNDLLLQALACRNVGRPPVWLMRQAGRYLPEYKVLRSRHSLWEMFHESDLAAEVTLMPLKTLGCDAAILFSDILVILESFGLNICFPDKGGPHLDPLMRSPKQVEEIPLHDLAPLSSIAETIKKVLPELKVPLIGFCGGPLTVASYCLEESHRDTLPETKRWIYQHPQSFHMLLKKITAATIDYLMLQIDAGVHAIQIFDSWAGALTHPHFLEFSYFYLDKILRSLPTSIPVILFTRGSSLFADDLIRLKSAAISYDWHLPLHTLRQKTPAHIAIQGNLDPDLLKAPHDVIASTVNALLDSLQGDKGFIVNLGHGVKPDTPVDAVKLLIDIVKLRS
jgi:uroporphyrinogen decarboxylase